MDAPKNNPSWQSVCDSMPVPGDLEVSTSRHSFMCITIWPKLQASLVLYLETLPCECDYTLALTSCYRYKVLSRLFCVSVASYFSLTYSVPVFNSDRTCFYSKILHNSYFYHPEVDYFQHVLKCSIPLIPQHLAITKTICNTFCHYIEIPLYLLQYK